MSIKDIFSRKAEYIVRAQVVEPEYTDGSYAVKEMISVWEKRFVASSKREALKFATDEVHNQCGLCSIQNSWSVTKVAREKSTKIHLRSRERYISIFNTKGGLRLC